MSSFFIQATKHNRFLLWRQHLQPHLRRSRFFGQLAKLMLTG